MSDVAVFGLGYVGCVTAACLARDGHRVIGVDVDAAKVAAVNAGESPVEEPSLAELVSEQVTSGRLRAVDSVDKAVCNTQLGLVAVGTPSGYDGSVCTAAVERVIRTIGQALRQSGQEYGVVIRSTLLPGVIEELLAPLLAEECGSALGERAWIANNPEFLRESTALRDYRKPPYVLVGAEHSWQAELVFELYDSVEGERIATTTRTAALVKYACNAFHAAKVAFANEVGALAQSLGADGHDVMRLVCRDRKLNISPAYLRPGFAFGGSCLPKDLRAIVRHAEKHALRLELLSAILPSNATHLNRAYASIQACGHRRVGLVGLSFKAGTDDLRESPLVVLAETLLGRGYALRIYDPGISLHRLRGRNLAYVDSHLPHLAQLLVDKPEELCAHAEMLVLGTNVADGVDWRSAFSGDVIDLRRDLALPVELQLAEA